ncbi:hypothetical protein [Paraburkholderia adhaesiva]|uniref:hypothetical protein n=1 Tax=Paraburkholderia adhaesiva TaxID=2883244 RepID=UPI001F204729|nr:hypothetical protein [Paraburkholderia adhaesiva]
MSRYLDLLKAMKSEKRLPGDPPKLPKVPEQGLGGFGGYPGDRILKNEPLPEAAIVEAVAASGEGSGGFGGCPGSPVLKNTSPDVAEAVEAANDPQAEPDNCAGALIDPDGGPYLPWGPYLEADNVRRLRAELFAMIDALARAEAWTPARYADTMDRAANGPLADLLPNIDHFHAKLTERRAEAEAAALLAARSWRLEGLEDRRG